MTDCHSIQRHLDFAPFRGAQVDIFDDQRFAERMGNSGFDDLQFQVSLRDVLIRLQAGWPQSNSAASTNATRQTSDYAIFCAAGRLRKMNRLTIAKDMASRNGAPGK